MTADDVIRLLFRFGYPWSAADWERRRTLCLWLAERRLSG